MSSLHRWSTTFTQPELTEELNSESTWIGGVISPPFHEETFGVTTSLDYPPAPLAEHLLSFEGNHLGPPPARSLDTERFNFTVDVLYNGPPDARLPEDLFDLTYQTTDSGSFCGDYNTCTPADITWLYDTSPPDQTTVTLPTSPSTSKPRKSSTSRGARRSQPYRRHISSHNLECGIDNRFDLKCPYAGCGHVQTNRRIPDLKRHIETHERWREPQKWICRGVGMDRAHLYGKGIKEGMMTYEECIRAGAYMFGSRLMIGGCMKTFSRRDALKRHVGNSNIPCVGYIGP